MSEPGNLLMLQFLEWISSRPRTYEEAMEAWKTSCPRHPVWEDALINGLIRIVSDSPLHRSEVILTQGGKAYLTSRIAG